MSGRDCVKALMKVGYVVDRQRGSHIILRRASPPPTRTVVVPDHREVDRGTLRSILRQAGLDADAFTKLIG